MRKHQSMLVSSTKPREVYCIGSFGASMMEGDGWMIEVGDDGCERKVGWHEGVQRVEGGEIEVDG